MDGLLPAEPDPSPTSRSNPRRIQNSGRSSFLVGTLKISAPTKDDTMKSETQTQNDLNMIAFLVCSMRQCCEPRFLARSEFALKQKYTQARVMDLRGQRVCILTKLTWSIDSREFAVTKNYNKSQKPKTPRTKKFLRPTKH
jgi:hypothetical protein